MSLFRYIADGNCSRNWQQATTFSLSSVTFEFLAPNAESVSTEGWPFIAYTDVDAKGLEDALRIGQARCTLAINVAVLVSGYVMQVDSHGVRRLTPGEKPAVIEIFAKGAIRSDPAPIEERELMSQLLRAAILPALNDPNGRVLETALRWYAQATADFDEVDRYIKLFTTLDMFIPPNALASKRQPFASRATKFLHSEFATAANSNILSCVKQLASIRNALVHDGVKDPNLPAAIQVAERIVRAILRRRLCLPDEFVETDLFIELDQYILQREGPAFGWLGNKAPMEARTSKFRLRAGDPENVDGKHVLYAREVGVEIRVLSPFRLN